ncbi:MAG: hypothetical protein ACUVRS_03910 [Armatimonadota bacterium]
MTDSRLKLDDNLEDLRGNLLKDVQAAAETVKRRRAAIREEEKRVVAKTRSRKQMALLVGIGVICVILLSYWIVFARPDATSTHPSAPKPANVQTQDGPKVKISVPATVTPSTPVSTPAAGFQPSKDSQLVEHPTDEYEPPSGDSGM